MTESKWKKMVEANTIFRCVVGSTAYGLSLGNSGDRDEVGVCIEPLEANLGFHEFDHYEYRTAVEREGVKDAPSQAGDLDLKIYPLKKFLKLALKGNPSVVEILFIREAIVRTALGTRLQELAPHIVSKQAGKAFLGYMQAQRERLTGDRGQKRVKRPELEEKYVYDTKYAMHIMRLGFEGVELLSTGKITLPFVGERRDICLQVRGGTCTLQEVLNWSNGLEAQLEQLLVSSPLPDHPNESLVEDWMISRYWEWWKSLRVLQDRELFGGACSVH